MCLPPEVEKLLPAWFPNSPRAPHARSPRPRWRWVCGTSPRSSNFSVLTVLVSAPEVREVVGRWCGEPVGGTVKCSGGAGASCGAVECSASAAARCTHDNVLKPVRANQVHQPSAPTKCDSPTQRPSASTQRSGKPLTRSNAKGTTGGEARHGSVASLPPYGSLESRRCAASPARPRPTPPPRASLSSPPRSRPPPPPSLAAPPAVSSPRVPR